MTTMVKQFLQRLPRLLFAVLALALMLAGGSFACSSDATPPNITQRDGLIIWEDGAVDGAIPPDQRIDDQFVDGPTTGGA